MYNSNTLYKKAKYICFLRQMRILIRGLASSYRKQCRTLTRYGINDFINERLEFSLSVLWKRSF